MHQRKHYLSFLLILFQFYFMPSMGRKILSNRPLRWDVISPSPLHSLSPIRLLNNRYDMIFECNIRVYYWYLFVQSLNFFLNLIHLLLVWRRDGTNLRVCLYLPISSPESKESPYKTYMIPLLIMPRHFFVYNNKQVLQDDHRMWCYVG